MWIQSLSRNLYKIGDGGGGGGAFGVGCEGDMIV